MSSIAGGRDPFSSPDSTDVPNQDFVALDTERPGIDPLPPLSLVPNSQTKRSSAGYGDLPEKSTAFGLNAKRSLLRQGGALEKVAPPEECLFLTGTLPGSTEDSFKAIAAWSGYIVHRLKSWIGNHERQKLDFYVWEYQKRGALHLHYCVWIRDAERRRIILGGFRQWWIQILHTVGQSAGCDMFRKNASKTHLSDLSKVRAVAEICRKSPARYLAKYLSKSANATRGNARFFTPSRWWGTSRPLKKLAESLTQVVDVIESGVNAVRRVWESVSHYCDTSESVTYSYRHKVGVGETYVCYPKTTEESECLMSNLKSLSIMRAKHSTLVELVPSQELKAVKISQMSCLEDWLQTSPNISTGLRNSLTGYLNWIQNLTPTTSVEPLSVLLAWAAATSDIASICQSTPLWSRENRKQLDSWINCLEQSIECVAEHGWS